MKVKPFFFYNSGVLADAAGNVVPATPAQMRIEDFSDTSAEAGIAALAEKGINFLLLRVSLSTIAPAPDSFNEAALARLREILKKAEERRVGAVLSMEGLNAAAGTFFVDAAEHAARRLKDCASLVGFAAPPWASGEFLSELAARLEKKHPALLFFVPPQAKNAGGCRPPLVAPEFWPQAWL